MDEHKIPDPVVRPDWKKTKPRGKKGLVRDFVLKRLQEGRLTDKQIAEECACLFDGSTSVKAVQWYKFQFVQKGLIEKSNRKRRKRRYLTEFTYELIFLQVDPPDNVEVVTAKQLIDFAKNIIQRYAQKLPKPIDEIVYDINTAKHYLAATGKFDVVDQNNYENPFEYKSDLDIEEEEVNKNYDSATRSKNIDDTYIHEYTVVEEGDIDE